VETCAEKSDTPPVMTRLPKKIELRLINIEFQKIDLYKEYV